MRALRPRVEALAGELLDDLARSGPPADLHAALALPLPVLVICELLGGGGLPRYARTDMEVEGVTIRAGELVLLDNGAANHDPAVFDEPDRFDVTRNAGQHMTFGHGAHYCIGAPLARIELQAVFAQLIPRFPTMRLAVAVEELTFRQDTLTGGLTELPVTW